VQEKGGKIGISEKTHSKHLQTALIRENGENG
jgi:hypothetical protein